jgi:hypothetical protein
MRTHRRRSDNRNAPGKRYSVIPVPRRRIQRRNRVRQNTPPRRKTLAAARHRCRWCLRRTPKADSHRPRGIHCLAQVCRTSHRGSHGAACRLRTIRGRSWGPHKASDARTERGPSARAEGHSFRPRRSRCRSRLRRCLRCCLCPPCRRRWPCRRDRPSLLTRQSSPHRHLPQLGPRADHCCCQCCFPRTRPHRCLSRPKSAPPIAPSRR